jgi:hypothetical protein
MITKNVPVHEMGRRVTGITSTSPGSLRALIEMLETLA